MSLVFNGAYSFKTSGVSPKVFKPRFVAHNDRGLEHLPGTACVVFEVVSGQITCLADGEDAAKSESLFSTVYHFLAAFRRCNGVILSAVIVDDDL